MSQSRSASSPSFGPDRAPARSPASADRVAALVEQFERNWDRGDFAANDELVAAARDPARACPDILRRPPVVPGGRQPAPDSYHWAPVPDASARGGQRHVFLGRQRDYHEGLDYSTLCGVRVIYTDRGDWLRWPTCMACFHAAE